MVAAMRASAAALAATEAAGSRSMRAEIPTPS
jgi:hypothetical protein